MFTATLIADSTTAHLNKDLLWRAKSLLSGGDHFWLAEAIACDIALPQFPSMENFTTAWHWAQQHQLDLIVQPNKGRRKKILLADMDSTMIQQECIDELATYGGFAAEVAKITAKAMVGELDFAAALRARVSLLAGLDLAVIKKILLERIKIATGAVNLVATMQMHGGYCALVSGGFNDFAQPIATELGCDEFRANQLQRCNGRLSGQVLAPILDAQAKAQVLIDITTKLSLTPQDVIAIGDGANDLAILTLAGCGVAIRPKPFLAARCRQQLNFADLTGVLYLQGYQQTQFAK